MATHCNIRVDCVIMHIVRHVRDLRVIRSSPAHGSGRLMQRIIVVGFESRHGGEGGYLQWPIGVGSSSCDVRNGSVGARQKGKWRMGKPPSAMIQRSAAREHVEL